jgi:tetratricopeptide (TPR) repeat protein
MQDSSSFWTDIKNLEEQLAKSPGSLCFARLSDVYLKVGLIDDALNVARQGVTRHPRYLSGQRAFAMACHAKGLNGEALTALKLVTDALPEDIKSQKMLGRLYADAGNHDAAMHSFQTALEFAPDDTESRIELETLERSAGISQSDYDDDDDIIEDLEIYEEFDGVSYYKPGTLPINQTDLPETDISAVTTHDPLSTGTLAELYVKQGFILKALEIYRAILAENPADQVTAKRVVELEALESASSESESPESGSDFEAMFTEEAEDDSTFVSHEEVNFQQAGAAVSSEASTPEETQFQAVAASEAVQQSRTVAVPSHGMSDQARATLEGWLENIRRIKSCR